MFYRDEHVTIIRDRKRLRHPDCLIGFPDTLTEDPELVLYLLTPPKAGDIFVIRKLTWTATATAVTETPNGFTGYPVTVHRHIGETHG